MNNSDMSHEANQTHISNKQLPVYYYVKSAAVISSEKQCDQSYKVILDLTHISSEQLLTTHVELLTRPTHYVKFNSMLQNMD